MSKSITNSLLGIIAFCLLLNVCIQLGFIQKASAGEILRPTAPTEVVIVGIKGNDTNIPINERIQNGLPVKVIPQKKENL